MEVSSEVITRSVPINVSAASSTKFSSVNSIASVVKFSVSSKVISVVDSVAFSEIVVVVVVDSTVEVFGDVSIDVVVGAGTVTFLLFSASIAIVDAVISLVSSVLSS